MGYRDRLHWSYASGSLARDPGNNNTKNLCTAKSLVISPMRTATWSAC